MTADGRVIDHDVIVRPSADSKFKLRNRDFFDDRASKL
jgi:hypothetical protein